MFYLFRYDLFTIKTILLQYLFFFWFFQSTGFRSRSNTILLSSSGTYHTSSLPSFSLMSSHFSGTVHLSQDNTTPNPSRASAAIFLSQSDVTLPASSSNVTSSLRQSISNYSLGVRPFLQCHKILKIDPQLCPIFTHGQYLH